MTETFPIIEVDRESADDLEQLGTKRKFWFRHFPDEAIRWLFKVEERETGEDWAEKIACELMERFRPRYAARATAAGADRRPKANGCG